MQPRSTKLKSRFKSILGMVFVGGSVGASFGGAIAIMRIFTAKSSFGEFVFAIVLFGVLGVIVGGVIGLLFGKSALVWALQAGKAPGLAAGGLARLGGDGVGPLINALHHEESSVVIAAMNGINMLQIEALPQLIRGMSRTSKCDFVEGRIIHFGAPAVPHLVAALRTKDPFVAIHAARTLTKLDPGNQAGRDCLIGQLAHAEPGACFFSAQTLFGLEPGNRNAQECMVRLLATTDITIRYAAVREVRDGTYPKEMVYAALVALERNAEEDTDIRNAAREALSK